jgi:hypothetical protein
MLLRRNDGIKHHRAPPIADYGVIPGEWQLPQLALARPWQRGPVVAAAAAL